MAGDRLPAPPRERRPALAALAALLVLIGALGATMLVLRAGDRVEVVQITERVPTGQRIPESAVTPVLVAEDAPVNYVHWNQRNQLPDLYTTADLVPGTVLVEEMLSRDEQVPEGQVLVGLSLQPGQFPAGLRAGATVAAYWVGDEGSGPGGTGGAEEDTAAPVDRLLVEQAGVHEVPGGAADGTDSLAVTLRVDEADAPGLTRAASEREVVLVVVGSGAGEE